MSFWDGKKVLVTGGAGFLGTYIIEALKNRGAKPENIIVPRSANCDLREKENCRQAMAGVDIVIHLAAHVGGIALNKEKPGEIFYDNALMTIQLIEEARQAEVKKFVGIGSVCSYPKFTPVPFNENNLWDGYPEETNAAYGLAKKLMLVQSQAYRQQYGFNAIHLLMVNLYGPGDNFDLHSSHVIPALIRKIYNAKCLGTKYVDIWGSGRASREFLYVKDAAEGIILAAERYNEGEPVNLGSGEEITIKKLAALIARLMNFEGEIRYDLSKPDGQPRRCLDVSRAFNEFGFKAKTNFEEGLSQTADWYSNFRNLVKF